MTQPFADALTWVPKSRALGATLGRAHDLARAQGHAQVTLEHLLLALIEDPDAASVLLACNIDLLSLNTAATAQVEQQVPNSAEMPEAAPGLMLILEYAVAAARQSRRTEVNGAIVLAAIVGEGKSEAARMLHALGITFEGTVQALRRASTTRPHAHEDVPDAAREPPASPVPEQQPNGRQPTPETDTGGTAQSFTTAQTATPATAYAHSPSKGHSHFDDDPVTTARRRIDAIRNGQQPPAAAAVSAAPAHAPPDRGHEPAVVAVSPAQDQPHPAQLPSNNGPVSDWAPQPHAPPSAVARPVRMPPPVPPMVAPPVRQNGQVSSNGANGYAHAPWADSEPLAPAAQEVQPNYPPARLGPPIDPVRVAERIPALMQVGTPATVEARIARSAVMGTAHASNAATPAALTRALSVRLRAPSGGLHVEPAAPETQWFDARAAARDDDEVRWRWVVTPHDRGTHPLQLSISMRTIAADGMMIESVLPDHQVSVRIGRSYPRLLRTWGGLLAATVLGACIALLANGRWATVVGALGG